MKKLIVCAMVLLLLLTACRGAVEQTQPTAAPEAEATPEPTEEPTPVPTEEPAPDLIEIPTPEPTPEPTPTPEPYIAFHEEFRMISPEQENQFQIDVLDAEAMPEEVNAEVRLEDGTVIGTGTLKKGKKDYKLKIKLPSGSPVRTTMYLYVDGIDYPINSTDVAVYDTEYVPVVGNYERDDMMIAITFDYAYGETNTDWLLDVLDQYNMKCTMFMTDEWMKSHSSWVERIIEAGHEIGSHSVSHPRLTSLSATKVVSEIKPTVDRMLNEHGYRIHVFRPPFGASNPKVNTISRYFGLEVIMWGLTSKDANDAWDVEAIENLLFREIKPGHIILCHNGAKHLKKYLIPVLDEFIARGYTFCTVSELMGWEWDDTYTLREQMKANGDL